MIKRCFFIYFLMFSYCVSANHALSCIEDVCGDPRELNLNQKSLVEKIIIVSSKKSVSNDWKTLLSRSQEDLIKSLGILSIKWQSYFEKKFFKEVQSLNPHGIDSLLTSFNIKDERAMTLIEKRLLIKKLVDERFFFKEFSMYLDSQKKLLEFNYLKNLCVPFIFGVNRYGTNQSESQIFKTEIKKIGYQVINSLMPRFKSKKLEKKLTNLVLDTDISPAVHKEDEIKSLKEFLLNSDQWTIENNRDFFLLHNPNIFNLNTIMGTRSTVSSLSREVCNLDKFLPNDSFLVGIRYSALTFHRWKLLKSVMAHEWGHVFSSTIFKFEDSRTQQIKNCLNSLQRKNSNHSASSFEEDFADMVAGEWASKYEASFIKPNFCYWVEQDEQNRYLLNSILKSIGGYSSKLDRVVNFLLSKEEKLPISCQLSIEERKSMNKACLKL